MIGRVLGLLAALGTAASAAPGKPLTARDVIAAFEARDWKKLRTIVADGQVVVMPDGGIKVQVETMTRDALFARLRGCSVDFSTEQDEYQPTNAVLMICRNEPVVGKRCEKHAFGMDFRIIGNKAVLNRGVYHTTWHDRIACPSDGRAPPPPAPPPPAPPRS